MDPQLRSHIRNSVWDLYEDMIRLRRDLHAHPEIAFTEERTARRVVDHLMQSYPQIGTGIAQTGVSVLHRPAQPTSRAILLRADMDALPIQEESTAPYASQNAGVMHACGHDGHTSILVNTALIVAQSNRLAGSIRFIFQPAEEGPGGALPMIEAGVLDDPPIEAAFGLHLWSGLPTGKVAVKAGPMMAAADEFELIIRGRGGHGAYPHETVDSIIVASHLIVALQTLVSRNSDPTKTAVLSIGVFHAGDNFNIIAESSRLRGTLRTFDSDLRDQLIRRLRELSEGTCTAFGAECEFIFKEHYPTLVNDPAMADFVADIAGEIVGPENVDRTLTSMGGEDMSYYLERVPGMFLFLGAGNEGRGTVHPHHSPHFDFDEEAMPIGAEILLRITETYWSAFPHPPSKPSTQAT